MTFSENRFPLFGIMLYAAVRPPSSVRICPVIDAAAGLAR
jgi:hypothetical protein